jgi:hypothetical protein
MLTQAKHEAPVAQPKRDGVDRDQQEKDWKRIFPIDR